MSTKPTTTLISKILANLTILKQKNSSKKSVVIAMDSSVNPIHNQHILITLSWLRSKLNHKIKVVGGFVAPGSSIWLKKKLGNEAIGNKHRIKMAQITTEESDWMT